MHAFRPFHNLAALGSSFRKPVRPVKTRPTHAWPQGEIPIAQFLERMGATASACRAFDRDLAVWLDRVRDEAGNGEAWTWSNPPSALADVHRRLRRLERVGRHSFVGAGRLICNFLPRTPSCRRLPP